MPATVKTNILRVDYAAMLAMAIGIWIIAMNLSQ